MEKLSPSEEEAMLAIWETGEGSIKTFMQKISPPVPPYTTVASTIKNLEKKGFLSSRLLGNTYLYKPAISSAEYRKTFMNSVVKNHFSNSYKDLVNFFVDQKKLSPNELKEILKMIEEGNRKDQ